MAESYTESHVEKIRAKAKIADGLGEFWRGMMVGTLDAVDRYRSRSDGYGLALIMIREGGADPKAIADKALSKHGAIET